MKKIFLICLLLTLTQAFYSQEGWFLQYANDTTNLRSIFMLDTLTGWSVGPNTVLQTTNSGLSWTSKNIGVSAGSVDVFFINPNTGWIAGYTYIVKTTNSGMNWSTPIFFGISLAQILFVDLNTGFVIGNANCWRTTNGGNNWTVHTLSNNNFFSIYFINHDTGWIGGANGLMFKTTNCGLNWNQKNTGTDTRFYGISFITPDTGLAVGFSGTGPSRIHFSSNGGESWIEQYINSSILLKDIYFISKDKGWVIGGPGVILHTTNTGTSWEIQDCGIYNILLESVYFVTPRIGWIAGEIAGANGKIFKTTTGGIVPLTKNVIKYPNEYTLNQNFPNPFNTSTIISYDLPINSDVNITIYNILGKEIQTLVNQNQKRGKYKIFWNATNHSSGLYFYTLRTEKYVETKKMILIK